MWGCLVGGLAIIPAACGYFASAVETREPPAYPPTVIRLTLPGSSPFCVERKPFQGVPDKQPIDVAACVTAEEIRAFAIRTGRTLDEIRAARVSGNQFTK